MSDVTNTPEKPVREGYLIRYKKLWQSGAKISQLVLCLLCLGLVMEPAKRGDLARIHLDHFALIFPTFIGHLLIVFVFFVGRAIGDKIPYRTGFILSVVASCMFFASGILLAIDRKKQYVHDDVFFEPQPYILRLLAASAAFSFLNSILFGAEALYTWKFREDF